MMEMKMKVREEWRKIDLRGGAIRVSIEPKGTAVYFSRHRDPWLRDLFLTLSGEELGRIVQAWRDAGGDGA